MKREIERSDIRLVRSGLLKVKRLKAELRRSRSDNVQVLRHYLNEQNKLMEMDESLRYARHLHDALLPGEDQLRAMDAEAFTLNLPREKLSGDFCWFTRAGSRLIVAVADCTGHGIPGALMSVLGLTFLNQVVLEERTYEPSHILRRLDKKMHEAFRSSDEGNRMSYDGLDIALCVIDLAAKTICFSGAFRPAYLFGKNQLQVFRGSRYPIGGLRLETHRTYPQTLVPFQPGDMLYLFSDGVVDQFGGPFGKKLTAGRFRALLEHVQPMGMEEQKNFLHEAILLWKGMEPQTDDMLLLGLRL